MMQAHNRFLLLVVGGAAALVILSLSVQFWKRKRALFQTETVEIMRQIQAEDVVQQELNRTQQLQLVRESQELEATLRREENAQAAAFNQSFLGLLGQLVEAMSGRRN